MDNLTCRIETKTSTKTNMPYDVLIVTGTLPNGELHEQWVFLKSAEMQLLKMCQ